MDIQESSLYRIIDEVQSAPSPAHYTLTAKIHIKEKEYIPIRVLNLDINRDPTQCYADVMMLTVLIGAGTYAKQIHPNMDILEITITKQQVEETTGDPNLYQPAQVERYAAQLNNVGNPIVEGNAKNVASEETLNLTSPVEIHFQLIDKTVMAFRLATFGVRIRNEKLDNVLKSLMHRETLAATKDKKTAPEGVKMVPASNKEVRENINIPDGTRLVDLPALVHYEIAGIYSAGLGYYFYNKYWYIWPALDVTRYNKSQDKLFIINVPNGRLDSSQRTFQKKSGIVTILATGDVKILDHSDANQLNVGNAVMYADAGKVMDGFVKVGNNKAIAKRKTNTSEFKSVERRDKRVANRMTEERLTSNPFVESSRMASRNGSVLHFEWQNSDHTKLLPDMPVRLMYLSDDKVKELYGILMASHTFVTIRDVGATATRLVSTTQVTVFIERLIDKGA